MEIATEIDVKNYWTPKLVGIERFCCSLADEVVLSHPWFQAGYLCACNGRVAVRVRAGDEPDTQVKGVPKLDEMCVFPAKLKPWPEVKLAKGDCMDCMACCAGKIGATQCIECDGRGEKTCDLGHDHDCSRCDGSGSVGRMCRVCNGKGSIDFTMQVGKQRVAPAYYALIRALPNVRYHDTGEGCLIVFKFDGGEGAVCGLASST